MTAIANYVLKLVSIFIPSLGGGKGIIEGMNSSPIGKPTFVVSFIGILDFVDVYIVKILLIAIYLFHSVQIYESWLKI